MENNDREQTGGSNEEIDPVTLSVIRGRLDQLTNEMDVALVRTAFSPIICEALDMANGIFKPNGNTISQGESGVPVFVGNMEILVTSIVEQFEGDINEGDIFITNNPYVGGTHLNDVKLIKPIFREGELQVFLANTGHWADIGAGVPGGFSGKAREIYQEGIRIPPVKLIDNGETNDELLETVFSNVRQPDNMRGDFKAQLNSLEVGEERYDELVEQYSPELLSQAFDELEKRSEEQMRSKLGSVPDGTYDFVDYVDNDGVRDEPIPIEISMEVDGTEVLLNLDAPEGREGPFNVPKSSAKSACNLTIKHIFPDIPINAGCFKPINYDITDGSVLDAQHPDAVGGYPEMSARVIDVVLGAFSNAIPEKVPAHPFNTSSVVVVGGEQNGEEYVAPLLMSGGYGGSKQYDGLNHCTTPVGRARMAGVEVMEDRYPLRYNWKALRPDSAGPGRRRGGLGTRYELEMIDDTATVSFVGDRVDFTPKGAAGGKPADGAKFEFVIDGEEYTTPLRSKGENIELSSGDQILIESPGGGGYNDPEERERDRVIEDIELGYITVNQAREEYGVDVSEEDLESRTAE